MGPFHPEYAPKEEKTNNSSAFLEELFQAEQAVPQNKGGVPSAPIGFEQIAIREQSDRLVLEHDADLNQDSRLTKTDLDRYKPKNNLERQAVNYLLQNYDQFAKTPADKTFFNIADAKNHKFADANLNQALARLSLVENRNLGRDDIANRQENITEERKIVDGLKDILNRFDEIKGTRKVREQEGIDAQELGELSLEGVSDPAVKQGLEFLQHRVRFQENFKKSDAEYELKQTQGRDSAKDENKEWQNVVDNFDKIKTAAKGLPLLASTAIPVKSLEVIDKSKISDPKMRDALTSLDVRFADSNNDKYITKSELQQEIKKVRDKTELQYVIDHFVEAQNIAGGLDWGRLLNARSDHPGLRYLSNIQNLNSVDKDRNVVISKGELNERIGELEKKLATAEQNFKDYDLVNKNFDLIIDAVVHSEVGIGPKDLPTINNVDYENAFGSLINNHRGADKFKFSDFEKKTIDKMLGDDISEKGVAALESRLKGLTAGSPFKVKLSREEFETAHGRVGGEVTGRRVKLELLDAKGKTVDSVVADRDTVR